MSGVPAQRAGTPLRLVRVTVAPLFLCAPPSPAPKSETMIKFQFRFGALSLEEWAEALSPSVTEEYAPDASKPAPEPASGASPSESSKVDSSKLNGVIPEEFASALRPKDATSGVHSSPVSSASSGTTSASGSSAVPAAPAAPVVTLSWAERVVANMPRAKSAAATRTPSTPSPPPVPRAPLPPLPDRRIRGLVNGGNTCFISVILQALIACDPFRRFLLGRRNMKSNPPLLEKFVSLAADMTVAAAGESEPVPAAANSKTLPNLDEPLLPDWCHDIFPSSLPGSSSVQRPTANGGSSTGRRGGSQEDAQEFLTFLLNLLHEELLTSETHATEIKANGSVSRRANELATFHSHRDVHNFTAGVENGGGEWQEMNRRGRPVQVRGSIASQSAITKIFGGGLRSELKRPRAKTSITREPFLSLSLDIDSGMIRHVEDALAAYFQMEHVEGYTAEDSHETVEAKKQVLLETLPPVLILHLKRFSHNTQTGALNKVGRRLDFPEMLSIPASIFYGTKTAHGVHDRHYRLTSVVTHIGKELAGGHYLCDVKLGKGPKQVWASCDDSKVSMVNIQNVLRRQAYLLFYTRSSVGD